MKIAVLEAWWYLKHCPGKEFGGAVGELQHVLQVEVGCTLLLCYPTGAVQTAASITFLR